VNARVEKLATDSYAIHSEVREIHESVTEMRTALSDIVTLYKTILTQYGLIQAKGGKGGLPARDVTSPKARPGGERPGGEPGDHIVKALERERSSKEAGPGPRNEPPRSRTVPPKPGSRERPVSRPLTTPSALDELHRLSEDRRADDDLDSEPLAERMQARSGKDDRVDRVAKRDMGRMEALDRGSAGEFTRPLPRKHIVEGNRGAGPAPGAWEAMDQPPPSPGPKVGPDKRPKPRLEDLLDPE
jgi:hypothetical protein